MSNRVVDDLPCANQLIDSERVPLDVKQAVGLFHYFDDLRDMASRRCTAKCRSQGNPRQIEPNADFHHYQQDHLKYPPVSFDAQQRQIVLDTLLQHCRLKAWRLYAAHVRTTHIHHVVQSDQTAEKVTSDLKAWCTRRLRQANHTMPKVWTRQGSTVYVFTRAKLIEKIRYVVQEQGEPMSVYVDEDFFGLLSTE